MELVDTHCHLQFEKFSTNLDQIIQSALEAGVKKMICVGTNMKDSTQAADFARKYNNIWAASGVHPHDAKDFKQKDSAELRTLLAQSRVVAIGETGLDYYKDYSPREAQKEALHAQIKIGLELDIPFIFHVRDAWEDFWEVFDCYCNIKGVVHSFSATSQELEDVLSRDLYVALNGIMTFTTDQSQLAAARQVPSDRLLLETDAPFLTPKSERGKTCEPKHILDIAKFLANLRGEALNELANYTTRNARELFGI